MRTYAKVGGLAVITLVIAACSGGGGGLDVSLSEWQVEATTSPAAGNVEVNVTNEGGEAHELVIVKGVAPGDLPVDENGAVIEDDLPDGAFIGEIEELEAGSTDSASFDLEAGTYTLFCNITEEEDDGTVESHFKNGMVTTIEVSG